MTKIIALTSGKGGVGKSQIAANLAYILSENGYKTALLEVSDLPNLDIIINASNIPRNIARLDFFKSILNTDATSEPVQAPVPGSGIPTNNTKPQKPYLSI